MAVYLTERELRKLRRDRERERQLQEEQDRRERILEQRQLQEEQDRRKRILEQRQLQEERDRRERIEAEQKQSQDEQDGREWIQSERRRHTQTLREGTVDFSHPQVEQDQRVATTELELDLKSEYEYRDLDINMQVGQRQGKKQTDKGATDDRSFVISGRDKERDREKTSTKYASEIKDRSIQLHTEGIYTERIGEMQYIAKRDAYVEPLETDKLVGTDLERMEKEFENIQRERRLLIEAARHDLDLPERGDIMARDENLSDLDGQSELSELGTIDEFLHESTRRSMKSLQDATPLKELQYRNLLKKSEDLYGISKQNIAEDQQDKCLPEKLEERKGLSGTVRETPRTLKADSFYKEATGCRPFSKEADFRDGKTIRQVVRGENNARYTEYEILKLKHEQEEVRSQCTECDRESLKLKKMQLEEAERKHLILERDKRLMYEIERKRRAKTELLERIEQIEKQEKDLNWMRMENIKS